MAGRESQERVEPARRQQGLCERCRALDVSLEKFLPRYPGEGQSHRILDRRYDAAGLQVVQLGYLDEIYLKRNDCSFCRLLFHGTHTDDGGTIDHAGLLPDGTRVSCQLDWQLDARFLSDRSRLLTRRIRISQPQKLFPDAYIVPLSSGNGDKSESEAAEETKPIGPSFLGRHIDPSRVDQELLRRWMDTCRVCHGESCSTTNRSLMPHPSTAPLRVVRLVDVDEERLVTFGLFQPWDFRYATISYVWGRTEFIRLTKSNKNELHRHFGPYTPRVPPVLRDAMLLTKALGLRYIWIDTVCIVQDDVEDWSRSAALMDRIYGNGTLNICAAAGQDASTGLPGCPLTPRRSSTQHIARYNKNLDLTVVRPGETMISGTRWNTRAWTFQERMLSRRSIIFVDDRVFFQCRNATWSEDMDAESDRLAWTLDTVDSPLQNYFRGPVWFYMHCVEMYSARLLSHYKDRLLAFLGMVTVLRRELRSRFMYGLPDSHFDLALLWEPTTESDRLRRGETEYDFPSWSWCGWRGAASWRPSMVTAILVDFPAWKRNHTWVKWYMVENSGKNPDEAGATIEALRSSVGEDDTGGAISYRGEQKVIDRTGKEILAYSGAGDISARHDLPREPTSVLGEPGRLYFWTYTAYFQLFADSNATAAFSSQFEDSTMHRFGLLDNKGDWCGTIVLPQSWFNQVDGIYQFAAISEARDFSMEELDIWNYYIPEARELSEWYLFYALLIVWNEEHTVAERMGVAKIYKNAFESSSAEPGLAWSEIVLG